MRKSGGILSLAGRADLPAHGGFPCEAEVGSKLLIQRVNYGAANSTGEMEGTTKPFELVSAGQLNALVNNKVGLKAAAGKVLRAEAA